MYSPPLYSVLKLPISYIVNNNYNIKLTQEDAMKFQVLQGDNMLFRLVRMISNDYDKYQKFVVFVDSTGCQNKPDVLKRILEKGFSIGKFKYVLSERSASMVRQNMLSFVESHIEPELNRRISMDLDFADKKVTISKLLAYRGLCLSSCHCLEDWIPKIVVVDDYKRTIPDQTIKYVYDKKISFIDRNTGSEREWVQKDIATKETDIDINAFDGCGICHPSIMREFEQRIGTKEKINSIILRAPYIKGCIHEMDYESFYKERGVTAIKDIWGHEYDVTESGDPLIIITVSMYKGYSYFNKTGTYSDWDTYWKIFKKYNHCIGVAKWNFTIEQEPLKTRINYQILQDLDLPFDEFKKLADESIEWYENIINGNPVYTYCFLGLMAPESDDDLPEPMNNYMAAIIRNPEMLKEPSIKDYLHSLLEKYRNEFKCGKLWANATFKFLVPDMIALMEYIGGLPVVGCLEANEFYSFDRRGVMIGERLIERNPHICRSEHTILCGVDNDITKKYCSHLVNCAMVNIKSITPQRLNGADYDGDIVLVTDNQIMMSGVHRDIPVVIDIEDKITALSEFYTKDNTVKCIMRGMKNMIGEISNMASTYHNKVPLSEKTKQEYETYVDLLSIINGKQIDRAKTGVSYPVPRNIAAYARPLPYFMKYAGPYYSKLKNLSKSHSNMNLLCMSIERWERSVKYRRPKVQFDWKIMYDDEVGYDEDTFNEIEKIFLEFNEYRKDQLLFEKKCKNWSMYKKEISKKITKAEARSYETNWQSIYNVYRNRCTDICPNIKELANILVVLCYEKYPNKYKKFAWQIAGSGIVENIKPVPVSLPKKDDNGDFYYLGNKYSMAYPNIYNVVSKRRKCKE